MEVRQARQEDAEAVAAIYNEGIAERVATFQTTPQDPQRFREQIEAGRFPVLVAELDGTVIGFVVTSAYSEFPPYAGIAEFGLYIAAGARRRGAGRALMEGLIAAAPAAGLHKLIGKVFTSNAPSISLLKQCGFREVGIHERHGQLEGEWKDVALLERLLIS